MSEDGIASRHLTTVFKGSVGAGIRGDQVTSGKSGGQEHGMHNSWSAQGVSGIDLQGMGDHGELGKQSFRSARKGKEFCLVGVLLVIRSFFISKQ